MNKVTYLTLSFAGVIALLAAQLYAEVVIDTPRGQFACAGGGNACTVVDVYAASKLLGLNPKDWSKLTSEQLAHLVQRGVIRYRLTLKKIHKPITFQFQALEATPHFDKELEQLDIIDIAPQMTADVMELKAAGMPITTPEFLPETIKEIGAPPVCGVWTRAPYSQLICSKDGAWLFLDSHHQSDNSSGASLRIFENDEEFREFLTTHPAFELGPETTANVTLYKRKVIEE